MNFLFGPVNSRRLGRSLGIDLFREKICNLNCVYCEVGPTTVPANRRGLYSPTREILAEITEFCSDPHRLAAVDVLTVTAKGEPTLHLDLLLVRGLSREGAPSAGNCPVAGAKRCAGRPLLIQKQ